MQLDHRKKEQNFGTFGADMVCLVIPRERSRGGKTYVSFQLKGTKSDELRGIPEC
jgi:hypothetical protein